MLSKNVLLSAEMLNVLNMLHHFCHYYLFSVPVANSAENDSTYSTYSTFLLKEAHFSESTYQHIQHVQHFSRKKHTLEKKGVLSAEIIQHRPLKCSYQQKNSTCAQNRPYSAEMVQLVLNLAFSTAERNQHVEMSILHQIKQVERLTLHTEEAK